MNKIRSRATALLIAALTIAGAAGCDTATVESTPTKATTSPSATAEQTSTAPRSPQAVKSAEPEQSAASPMAEEKPATGGTALALLETIEIKGRAPKTGYDRDEFGYGWMDPDHNGCDTRIICTAQGV